MSGCSHRLLRPCEWCVPPQQDIPPLKGDGLTAKERYDERMNWLNRLRASGLFTGNDLSSDLHMLELSIEDSYKSDLEQDTCWSCRSKTATRIREVK